MMRPLMSKKKKWENNKKNRKRVVVAASSSLHVANLWRWASPLGRPHSSNSSEWNLVYYSTRERRRRRNRFFLAASPFDVFSWTARSRELKLGAECVRMTSASVGPWRVGGVELLGIPQFSKYFATRRRKTLSKEEEEKREKTTAKRKTGEMSREGEREREKKKRARRNICAPLTLSQVSSS